MKTDTARLEQGAFSGSSVAPNPDGNSDRSENSSRRNSGRGPVKDGGHSAETNPHSLNVLLSMLQSHLGEIRDFGGSVTFFSDQGDLIIRLSNVAICQTHKQIHSGEMCPHC